MVWYSCKTQRQTNPIHWINCIQNPFVRYSYTRVYLKCTRSSTYKYPCQIWRWTFCQFIVIEYNLKQKWYPVRSGDRFYAFEYKENLCQMKWVSSQCKPFSFSGHIRTSEHVLDVIVLMNTFWFHCQNIVYSVSSHVLWKMTRVRIYTCTLRTPNSAQQKAKK